MSQLSILSSFSATYVEAREKFLSACKARDLTLDSRLNPHAKGAKGEALYTDIVQIGRKDAPNALLLLSGTHGVEGYCGSGAQVALLNEGYFGDIPDDLTVIIIHAMNPYGFSHDRRVTEGNVDLNRNFMDFNRQDLPGRDYARIHEFILPTDWDGPGRQLADDQIAKYITENGVQAFQAAASSGQYLYPDGIFYGGNEPSWSNQMFRSVALNYLANKSLVGVIDFHTGLGPHGYGELIASGSDAQKALCRKWYGDQITDPEKGTSSSASLDGMVSYGLTDTLSDTEIAYITVEFGTYDIIDILTALRGDNWLYEKGDVDSALGQDIKAKIRRAFYPDTDSWKQSVWLRSEEVVQLALKALA